jgi:hypothetical protein
MYERRTYKAWEHNIGLLNVGTPTWTALGWYTVRTQAKMLADHRRRSSTFFHKLKPMSQSTLARMRILTQISIVSWRLLVHFRLTTCFYDTTRPPNSGQTERSKVDIRLTIFPINDDLLVISYYRQPRDQCILCSTTVILNCITLILTLLLRPNHQGAYTCWTNVTTLFTDDGL